MANSGKIVKVTPVDNWVSITWELSNRCNQSCCYCPSMLHSFDGRLFSLDELKSIWMSIYDKSKYLGLKYKVSITGGEVTTQKSLMPFLEWLRVEFGDRIAKILVTTNGTASANYYIKLLKLIDNLSISLHSEYINEIKFFDKIVAIKAALPENKFLHVNIMDEPWNQERIPYYEQILNDHDIYYSVNSLYYTEEAPLVPLLNKDLNFDLSRPYKLQLRDNS